MREVITLQVGQCGNQIGNAFWNLLLLEHELTSDEDTALSSFFYREQKGRNHVLRARALLVDMECGPLQETMRSPLGNLFNDTQYIMDVSGAGNNFAHGYFFYGPQYQDKLCEGIRRNVERCESLQAFSLIHSLGGGTGSGVGSYLLSLLADEFNKVTRFSTCIYPSEENDVITSPYNTILSTRELVLSADCVFPLKNSALFSFHQSENPTASTSAASVPTADPSRRQKDRGFDLVNLIAARMLCNVTSSSRFHGELNVDLNEIYTNLVPFPKLHFLCGALNIRYPTTAQQRLRSDYSRTALQRAFADVTGPRGQLTGIQGLVLQTSPPIMIASAFLGRGKIILSDFLRCVSRAQSSFRFPVWNSDACKIGLCGSATPGEEMSVMALYNSSSFAVPLSKELQNFQALFRAKAMLHHYTKFTEEETIRQAEYEVFELYEAYRSLQQNVDPSSGKYEMIDNSQLSGYSRFGDKCSRCKRKVVEISEQQK